MSNRIVISSIVTLCLVACNSEGKYRPLEVPTDSGTKTVVADQGCNATAFVRMDDRACLARQCEQGNGDACLSVAAMCAKGKDGPVDNARMRYYLILGCEKAKHAAVCAELSDDFYAGWGGPKNSVASFETAKKACALGYKMPQALRNGTVCGAKSASEWLRAEFTKKELTDILAKSCPTDDHVAQVRDKLVWCKFVRSAQLLSVK